MQFTALLSESRRIRHLRRLRVNQRIVLQIGPSSGKPLYARRRAAFQELGFRAHAAGPDFAGLWSRVCNLALRAGDRLFLHRAPHSRPFPDIIG
jgi:hypothetical protein